MRRLPLFAGLSLALVASPAWTAGFTRQVRVVAVSVESAVPQDLARPEGKSRWDLSAAATAGPGTVRTIVDRDGVVTVDGAMIVDPTGGDAAVRWVLPDRAADGLRIGTRDRFAVEIRKAGAPERLSIHTEIVGIGWLHLPSGPREVVLERAFVDDGDATPSVVHRWIDPRAGVVAETASAPGASAASLESAEVVSEVLTGAADLKIYADQLFKPVYTKLLYGWDRGSGTPISALVPNPGIVTAGDLIALDSWDFSGNATGQEIAQTNTPINSSETCNFGQCGFNLPGAVLERQDRNFPAGPGGLRKDNQVIQRENRPGDVTVWLRAGAQKEGVEGTFGEGESRFCWVTDGSGTRPEVPLWRFGRQDAGGWHMAAGDTWEGGQQNTCRQTFFNTFCGNTGILTDIWAKSCDLSTSDPHYGKQTGEVLKGGVTTLPSGHTVNTLLVRTVADFCIYTGFLCLLKVDEVRTVIYLWEAPDIGTVGFIQSDQNVPNVTSWTTVDSTNFKFGLFPPVSITAGATTDSTVALTWNPGNDVRRLSGYKVYWDTDPGASTAYAFNSDTHPGQVAFNGTSATISGLQAGTTYYVTVTSLSNYTDPSSNITTRYESILYPTQVSGDPSFVYPIEVQATTTGGTCIPTAAVTNLLLGKSGPTNIQFCWNAATDPCLVGYDLLWSPLVAPFGFGVIAQTGAATTCWTGDVPFGVFTVVARGTGGSGPM